MERNSDSQTVEASNAGIFLLARAIYDARLHWLCRQIELPASNGIPAISHLLLALASHWLDSNVENDELDAGLIAFCGLQEPIASTSVASYWQTISEDKHVALQRSLLKTLLGQRLFKGETITLHHTAAQNGDRSLIVGADQVWPLGLPVLPSDSLDEKVIKLMTQWQETCDQLTTVTSRLPEPPASAKILNKITWQHLVDTMQPSEPAHKFDLAENELTDMLSTLKADILNLPVTDLTMRLLASSVLRLWARWIPRYSSSSPGNLLKNFITRPGHVVISSDSVTVSMARRPLDTVLEMVGYFDSLERVPWLEHRKIVYTLHDAQ